MPTSGYRIGAILLGLTASILIILGIGVFYGYWPSSLADNLTAQQLGVLAAIAIAGAIGLEYVAEHHR